MSTPDAAPVEVEGGRVTVDAALWRRAISALYDWYPDQAQLAKAMRAGALPAAPTTPDIADERVRELADDVNLATAARRGFERQFGAMFQRGEYVGDVPAERYELALSRILNVLRAALATPSTPGAGQGAGERVVVIPSVTHSLVIDHDADEPNSWWVCCSGCSYCEGPYESDGEARAAWPDHANNIAGAPPEPATGQGEPS